MTVHHLNPTLQKRRDAVTRALDAGLPSMKEVERLGDWLGSGPVLVTRKRDRAKVEAALIRFKHSYDAAHSLDTLSLFDVEGGFDGAIAVSEKMISMAQAAKAVMELRAAGRLSIWGDRHD